MEIVLVGNGPSLKNRGLGATINQFEHVVRFNNFQIKGYEKDVGTKCTILARRSCSDVKLYDINKFSLVLNFVTYCPNSSQMAEVAKDVKRYYKDKCVIVDEKICKKIGQDIGLKQPAPERASIGILTIGYLIEKYSVLYICGFDNLKKDKHGIVHHYFPKKPKDAKFHNGIKESEYINKLIKEKKVIKL